MQYAAMIDMKLNKRKLPLIMWGGEDDGVTLNLSYEEYCIGMNYGQNAPFSIGDLSFTAQANIHDIPSYSLKIKDSEGGCIVYSGDTGYYDHLCDFAAEASYLFCECSLYAYQKGMVAGHLCSSEVGQIAATANVKNVILLHLPHYGNRESLVQEVGQNYGGKIVLAQPGMVLRT